MARYERDDRYDQPNATLGTGRMPDDNLAEIERRLDAGEWLRPGEVAALFGTTRTSIHRWMRAGKIRYRRRGPRRDRFLNPEDVRRELDEYRREHQNGADGAA